MINLLFRPSQRRVILWGVAFWFLLSGHYTPTYPPFSMEQTHPEVTYQLFKAGVLGDAFVVLNWETSSEENVMKYEIQRSKNGLIFEPIGVIGGGYSSKVLLRYCFTDFYPIPGESLYRLRHISSNDEDSFSEIVTVSYQVGRKGIQLIEASPMVFSDKVDIHFKTDNPGKIVFRLYDLLGHEVYQQVITTPDNDYLYQFTDTQNLSPGTYIAGLEDESRNIKIIELIKK